MISDLEGLHDPEAFPGAAMIAERLVTLPTHHLVSSVDERKLVRALRTND